MRTFGIMALTLGAAVVITAPTAQAQGFRGGFGGAGGYGLLSNKSVQQELKLEGEQAEKVSKIVSEINAKTREKMQDIPQEERREKSPGSSAQPTKRSRQPSRATSRLSRPPGSSRSFARTRVCKPSPTPPPLRS